MRARRSSRRPCSPRRSRRDLSDLGAAEPGPGGGDLPRRPLRRPRLRALEQRLVLGPPPALLQRPLSAARRRCSACGWSARSRWSPRRPLFAAFAQRRFGDRARWSPRCGSRPASPAWLLTGRMPFLLAVPFGLAALLAADRGRPAARRPCWRRSRASRARSRVCSSRSRGRRIGLAGRTGAGAPGWRSARAVADPRSSTSPSRPAARSRSCSRPSSRSRCSPRSCSGSCRPSTGAADRRGALRGAGARSCS